MTEFERFIVNFYDRGIIQINLDNGFEIARHRSDPTTPRSPLFYNLRTQDNPRSGRLTHTDVGFIARKFCDVVEQKHIDFAGIAPVANAGIPFAYAMQEEFYQRDGHRNVPVLLFEKGTGILLRNRDLPPGNTLLLLDDVISDGGSKERYIKGIRSSGYRVSNCLVFAERSPKGGDFLRSLGVELDAVTTAKETLSTLKDAGRIAVKEKEDALQAMERL